MLIYSHDSSTQFSNECDICDKTSRSGSAVLKKEGQCLGQINKNTHRHSFTKERITVSSYSSYSD